LFGGTPRKRGESATGHPVAQGQIVQKAP